jgi:amidohydrolase
VNSAAWRPLLAALDEELPAVVDLRHRLHADPRGFGDEADTAATVAAALGEDGTVVAGTGRLVSVGPEPRVVLRAELDALPLTERTGVPWAARNGCMHACGHDVHLAAVVAAARAIAATGGGVAALLQPREEGNPSGAADVVGSGVLTRLRARAVLAAHVQPAVAAGTMAVTAGSVNASADEIEISVSGRGGHAGYPHTIADPVLALAAVVVALQQVAARRVDPVHGAVCVITQLSAGEASNVVPERAAARGTLRLMTAEDRRRVPAVLREIARSVAHGYGCEAELTVIDGEPVLDNDPVLARGAAALLADEGWRVRTDFRSFGADDFSHYAAVAPSLMVFVGTGAPGLPGLHDPRFLPPDETVRSVAQALLAGYLASCAER